MEASPYVDATLEVYRGLSPNSTGRRLPAGLSLPNEKRLGSPVPTEPFFAIVKGAYKENADIAFPAKKDVDENYFLLAQEMLRAQGDGRMARAAFGTHDVALIRRLSDFASQEGLSKQSLEIQMLYGIQRAEQERLAAEGYRSAVLVSYGNYWYPWFVRRLAERPANLWFMLKNLFAA